jgi:hypothetical protein
MSDFLKKLGFQSAPYLAGNNAMYNPSSGATITTNSMGERMVDAPFLSSPQKMKSTKKDDDINPVQEFGYNPYEPSRVSLFGDPRRHEAGRSKLRCWLCPQPRSACV